MHNGLERSETAVFMMLKRKLCKITGFLKYLSALIQFVS